MRDEMSNWEMDPTDTEVYLGDLLAADADAQAVMAGVDDDSVHVLCKGERLLEAFASAPLTSAVDSAAHFGEI